MEEKTQTAEKEETTESQIQVDTKSEAFTEGLDLARRLEVEHAEVGRGSPRRL